MKPHMERFTTTGNLPGESRKFEIDPRAIAHILKLLTNLYSNVELAVVRELATNAIDSHIQAGVPDPIEVTTPSALSNFLVIRDHGVGMSVDELFELFSMYGASTKRESDDVTGMLGIGSKSPLAYTNSFTLISRKNGVQATVAVTKDDDGVGRLNVVDTCTTSERNGVEIRVPAKTGNQFEREARNLFKYWEAGTILLNGKDPERFDGLPLNDQMWLVQADRYAGTQSVIIQGRVPYPAGEGLSTGTLGLPHGYALVTRVPIGTVDPAPSRELLEFTPRTQNALKALAAKFKTNLAAAIQVEVDKASSKFEAMKVIAKWKNVLQHHRGAASWTYKGAPLPDGLRAPTGAGVDRYGHKINDAPLGRTTYVKRHQTGKYSFSDVPILDADSMLKCVFVTNYTLLSFTPTHRKKLEQWMARKADSLNAAITHYAMIDFKADLSWCPSERIVDWSVIQAEKLPSQSHSTGSSGRIPGSYDLYVAAGLAAPTYAGSKYLKRALDGIPGSQIDQTNPVYHIHGNTQRAAHMAPVLDNFGDKWTIICLPENRLAKFRRETPHIKNLRDALQDLAVKAIAKWTDDQKMALAIVNEGDNNVLSYLQPVLKQLDDGDLIKAYRLSKLDVKAQYEVQRQFGSVSMPLPTWKNPLDKYPLFDTYAIHKDPDHVVRYLNNEFAHQIGGTV